MSAARIFSLKPNRVVWALGKLLGARVVSDSSINERFIGTLLVDGFRTNDLPYQRMPCKRCNGSGQQSPGCQCVLCHGHGREFVPGILEALIKAANNAERVIWLAHDAAANPSKTDEQEVFYKSIAQRYHGHKRLRKKAPIDFWSTFEYFTIPGGQWGRKIEFGPYSKWINLNALAFCDETFKEPADRKYGGVLIHYGPVQRVCNYGNFVRKSRVPTCFASDDYRKIQAKLTGRKLIWMSAPPERMLADVLSDFGAGLYLEGDRLMALRRYPGRRFYEMLSAGLAVLVQAGARSAFDQCAFDSLDDYSVSNGPEVESIMTRRFQIATEQRRWAALAREERERVGEMVLEAWKDGGY